MEERQVRNAQIRAAINQKLIETGERDRLKDLLRKRLEEHGWRDQLKKHCKGKWRSFKTSELLSVQLVNCDHL